jgi:hypothetical protein
MKWITLGFHCQFESHFFFFFLTPLSTIFQLNELYRGSQFNGGETGVPGENHQPAASH